MPASNIAEKVIQWYESKPQQSRPHLGASLIGGKCSRQIWYSYRWAKAPSFPGNVLRLFEYGHMAEGRFIKDLKAITGRDGQVHDVGSDGKQFNFSDFGGHFSGSADGVACNLPGIDGWCLLEMKTHSLKSFEWLVKNGLQAAKPEHYAQMICYMGYLELPRALYIAENKNDDQLYTEIIEFNQADFDALKDKALRIIKSESPPPRLSDSIDNFTCEYCSYQSICHGDDLPDVNCRTCAHSTADVEDGGFICEKKQVKPDTEFQRIGCDEHLYIPSLINFATATAGDSDHVEYEHRDGRKFTNASYAWTFNHAGGYGSKEIREMGAATGLQYVDQMKADIPGIKVIGFTSIEDLQSDDLNDAPTKADSPAVKKKKAAIKKAVAAIPRDTGWSGKPFKFK